MLEAIVLDFDGVIVNSEPLHLRSYQLVLAEEGRSLSAHEYYEQLVGLSDETVFAALAGRRPDRRDWVRGMMARKTALMQELLREEAPLFRGAALKVRELAAARPLAVASGALRAEIETVLERAGIADCFTAIVAAGETPFSKPSPDPYVRAVELLSTAAGRTLSLQRVVAIEDTLQGLASARAAGLRTVGVSTTYPAARLTGAERVLPELAAVTLAHLEELVSTPSSSGSGA